MSMELTEGKHTCNLWLLEDKQILEESKGIISSSGEEQVELSPVDLQGGVYPSSYFDVKKYPTHWNLVGGWMSGISNTPRRMILKMRKIVGSVWQEKISKLEDRITSRIRRRSCPESAFLSYCVANWWTPRPKWITSVPDLLLWFKNFVQRDIRVSFTPITLWLEVFRNDNI